MLIIIPISLIWVTTFVQDQHFANQKEIKLYQNVQKKGTQAANGKLIEVLNFLFLTKKFNLIQQERDHPTLFKLSESLDTFTWWTVIKTILNYNFWNQQMGFGKLTAPVFYYFYIWTNFRYVKTEVASLDPKSSNYYNFYQEGFGDDIKRVIFSRIRGWSDLINESNKKNLSELRGLLKNKEVSNQIENVFNSIDKLLENDKVFKLFSDPKNKIRAENINFDSIFEFWTLWSELLKPFYAKLTTLKGNQTNKLQFIQTYLTKTLTNSQKLTLNQMVATKQTLNTVFAKLHYWNGLNVIEAVGEKLKTVTAFANIDWIKLVLEFFNPTDIKKTLNIFSTLLMEYLFDRIEQKIAPLKPQEYLSDVIVDLTNFFDDGLFANQAKFNFLLDGATDGFGEVIQKLAGQNSQWNVLTGIGEKLLKQGFRQTVFTSLKKLIQPELEKLKPKIKQWKNFLQLTKVVFGGFKIDKLNHIFENATTKAELINKLEALRIQFIKVTTQASDVKSNVYKNELIQMLVKTNDLLKFLISDTILKPTGRAPLDSNFWLFFSLIMLYLEQKDPSWKKTSEIAKIIAQQLNNEDVLKIATQILDLFDDFATIVNTFITWKTNYPKAIIPSDVVIKKIFTLLGIYEEELTDKTFVGKAFNTLIAIKKKYNEKIITISKTGENYFVEKVYDFLKLIKVDNWTYQIITAANDAGKIVYDVVVESRIKIKNKRYKYSGTIEIYKQAANIMIKKMKELPLS